MKPHFRRWIALSVLAANAFAQASVSFADCPIQRGALAPMIAQAAEAPCEMATHVKKDAPRYANRCVAHCTADLQLAGVPAVLVRSAADVPVLLVAQPEGAPVPNTGLAVSPPGAPPHRILLHSFLI